MKASEIRSKFLEFFKGKSHEIVPSDSLVPKADPTLLFTSAGMNQFKEQFMGQNITYKRAASSQKCLRTGDLENVGKTAYHHTFFEMLGNFSFGDYFKNEAILWGWEFMTKALGINEKKLWVSVYKDDDESYKIWLNEIKVPKEKIVKLGAKDNFWPSNAPEDGPNGPCGPCSEIFYDRGKDAGCGRKTCSPACDCERFVEVWNLVFTQFERKEGGELAPLPSRNIDTGMGLERITAVMQGAKTNFGTDLFIPIIEKIKEYADKLKDEDLKTVADHIRAVTFAIGDGIAPSNEERGYVIRKLIRRAYLRGGGKEPFLFNIAPKVVEVMKDAYPELAMKREEVTLIVKQEEEKFAETLLVAMPILEKDLDNAGKELKGDKIFKLVDTFGLPMEIIEIEAKKRKINIDKENFERLMEKNRALSRKGSKIESDIFAMGAFSNAPRPKASDTLPLKARIAFMVKNKKEVKKASKGDIVDIITDPQSSRFYSESGGQVGDAGEARTERGTIEILNTVKINDTLVHVCKVIRGDVELGDDAALEPDMERKKNIAKNHTATHLLHSALRKVLGSHVQQAGSLVAADRLRFDFTHTGKLSERELREAEKIVNDNINKAIKIEKEEKLLKDAKKEGALALFGEKYASKVKIVTAGDASKEVCGGTHVDNTGEIGVFRIVRESSVASGVRRVEALTSNLAREWEEAQAKTLEEKEKLLTEKEAEKRRARERLKEAEGYIDVLINRSKSLNGVKIINEEIAGANMDILRNLADKIKEKTKSAFIFLESNDGQKIQMILTGTNDLAAKKFNASEIIKPASRIINGSGGGRADFAQAGGKDVSKLSELFEFIEASAAGIIGGN